MNDPVGHFPPKQDVLGSGISLTSFEELVSVFANRPAESATVVTITNVHAVMEARRDPELRAAIDDADVTTPDGMPIAWALRSMGNPDQERVNGVKVTTTMLDVGRIRGWRHFFYGSTEDTLADLQAAVKEQYNGAEIAGAKSPPFRDLSPEEEDQIAAEIMETSPDFVWVGLGMPKQEKWMHRNRHRYPGVVLVGVGAAFDFIAGTKPEAPAWMQKAGLEWLFRLASEPRRLWRRYVFNNPGYLLLWAQQFLNWKLRNRNAGR
jgi:N-acetylglucosaminyldiphosphoundecaprenol N-acetyl-beta-D-mannosaminyltransferase